MTRLVVALFALIRISTLQQTCLDRFCSSLASLSSPTLSYASCTSSSSICPIIAASALSGRPGQGQPSHESWHWCGAPPWNTSSSPSHYSLELHMGRLCSCWVTTVHHVLLCCKHTHFHFSFCMLFSYCKIQVGGWNVSNLGGGKVSIWGVEMCQIWGVEMCWDEVNYYLPMEASMWHSTDGVLVSLLVSSCLFRWMRSKWSASVFWYIGSISRFILATISLVVSTFVISSVSLNRWQSTERCQKTIKVK